MPAESRANIKGYDWLKDSLLSPEGQKKIKMASKLKPIAQELGVSLSQMSIAWCLKNPNVSTVILGASKIEQLKENMKSLDVLPRLSENVMKQIEEVIRV